MWIVNGRNGRCAMAAQLLDRHQIGSRGSSLSLPSILSRGWFQDHLPRVALCVSACEFRLRIDSLLPLPPDHTGFSRTLHRKAEFFTIFRPFRQRCGDLLRSNQCGLLYLASNPSGQPPMMIIHAAKPLFAWDCLEDSPSLQTIKDLLAALPDGKLLDSLRTARGKGRNDYPVHVLWGVVVLRVALRHITTEAVLAELRRNEGLRRLIGIESEAGVPKPWNISRFEEVLGQEPHRTLLKEIFNVLIQRLGRGGRRPGPRHRR